jgi:putative ABC transport system permease protein
VGAVGTTALTLRPSALALSLGLLGGLLTAVVVIAWTLRQVARAPARSLLRGAVEIPEPAGGTTRHEPMRAIRRRRAAVGAVLMALLTAVLVASGLRGGIDPSGGFFGAGAAALATSLFALAWWLRRDPGIPRPASALRGLIHAGLGNASVRPGRTVLSAALIAFATFVIVAVGAFRREDVASPTDPLSGTGGYTLIAEAVTPLMYDPMLPAGRNTYGLDSPELQPILQDLTIDRFRLRPGDDGSCLNLYRPENPRLLAPTPQFVQRGGRFAFAGSLARSEAERANPWLLLNRDTGDGSVPAIVDATSLAYVFHKALGDDIMIARSEGAPVRLRVVATLSHSIFQSEVLVAEQQFVRLFPQNEGYRVWLVATPATRAGSIATLLEQRLSDFGVEVSATADRLLAYQRVENTYLSTFQALGALGLVLGTLGVGAVLLRNILERQREVALLQAVGYGARDVRLMIVSETGLLVSIGLLMGILCALLAVQPALARQGGGLPLAPIGGVVAAVSAAGLVSSLVAAGVALRLPLIASLRAE